jgi:hypothetical protein
MADACNENHHRDSCQYSVDIAKQFITLAAGGVAFIVGLATASTTTAPYSFYWVTGLFIFSIAMGLIYAMSVVAHVNKTQNYNVYTPQLKALASLQILSFLFGVIFLSYAVLWKLDNKKEQNAEDKSNLEIVVSGKQIKYTVDKETKINLKIASDGKIEFQTDKSK